MKLWLRSLLPALTALALMVSAAAAETEVPAEQTDDDGSIFNDWRVICSAEQACRMSQTIIQPSTRRLILQVKVFGGDDPTVLLTFPLGVLLSTGWQYNIDGGRPTLLPFEVCNSDGCHVGLKLTPTLRSAMAKGLTLQVRFFDAARAEVAPEVSLMGFTKAYEAMR